MEKLENIKNKISNLENINSINFNFIKKLLEKFLSKKIFSVFYNGKFFIVREKKLLPVDFKLSKVDYCVVNIPNIRQEFISLPIPNPKKVKYYIYTYVEAKLKINPKDYYILFKEIDEDPEKKEKIFSVIFISKKEISKIKKQLDFEYLYIIPIEFVVAASISSELKNNEFGIGLIKLGEELKVILVKDYFPIEIIIDFISFDYLDYINRIISYFTSKYSNYNLKLIYLVDIKLENKENLNFRIIEDTIYYFLLFSPKSIFKIKSYKVYFNYLLKFLYLFLSLYIIFTFYTSYTAYKNLKNKLDNVKLQINKLAKSYSNQYITLEKKRKLFDDLWKKYESLLKLISIDKPNFLKFLKTLKLMENKCIKLLKIYNRELYIDNIELKKNNKEIYLLIKGKMIGDTKGKLKSIYFELRNNFRNSKIYLEPRYPRPPQTKFKIFVPLERVGK